jgi:hypothetical protein
VSKYILVFRSHAAFDWTNLPKDEVRSVAGAWQSWIGSMGSVVQGGDAFKFGGKSVTKAGEETADNLLTGYVVVEADDFDTATKLAEGAPSVASGQGSIEVYELLPTRH